MKLRGRRHSINISPLRGVVQPQTQSNQRDDFCSKASPLVSPTPFRVVWRAWVWDGNRNNPGLLLICWLELFQIRIASGKGESIIYSCTTELR
jgi:hypothetical protein